MTNEETIAYFKECNETLISVAKDENVYDYEKKEIEAVCMKETFDANEMAIQALERVHIMSEEEFGAYLKDKDLVVVKREILKKALEQQSCEDCISREEASHYLCERLERFNKDELYDKFTRIIDDMYNKLPSVTSQPKLGEWIVTGYDYKCTNCEAEINGEINYMSKSKIKYCPYCGIKLEGEWDNNG